MTEKTMCFGPRSPVFRPIWAFHFAEELQPSQTCSESRLNRTLMTQNKLIFADEKDHSRMIYENLRIAQ